MNFGTIKADLYRRLRYTTSPPSGISTRIAAFVNETHRELLGMPGMERLRDDVLAVTAVANKARTGLPPSVARIQKIVDRVNNHVLRQVPLSVLRLNDPAQAFTGGFPLRYAVVGQQQVQAQPAAATGLWAVSDAAGDTTQTVRVETITTGGYPYRDSKALNGLTRVAIGVTVRTDHIDVTKFYLSAVAVGYVSLFDAAAAGNELARIEPGQTFARYLAVEWHPIQTADCTLYADVTRTVFDLSQDSDEPFLPPDFHEAIVSGAAMREYKLIDDSRYQSEKIDYQRWQNSLRSFVLNDGDRIASLRKTPVRWSQLGSQYPSGS